MHEDYVFDGTSEALLLMSLDKGSPYSLAYITKDHLAPPTDNLHIMENLLFY